MGKEHLTESKWKSLVSKNKLDDKTVQNALTKYSKLEGGNEYDKQLDALGEVTTAANKLKTKVKDNKDVAKFLDEMLKEAKSRTADVEKLKKQPEKEDVKEDDRGSDVKKFLARIRSGGEKRILQFMVCKKGANRAVTFAKRIGQKHRTELKKKVGDGARFVRGECAFEEGKFTFITPTAVSGLAKTIKKALAAETGKTDYKVRVRDEASSVVLDDETDGEDADFTNIPDLPEDLGDGEDENVESVEVVDEPDTTQEREAAFLKRMQAVQPRYQKAVSNGGPNVNQLQTLFSTIRTTAENKDYEHAGKLLDELESLLNGSQQTGGQSDPSQVPPPPQEGSIPPAPKAPELDPNKMARDRLIARLRNLTPEYKQAVGQGGPNVGEMKQLLQQSNDALQKSNIESATNSIEKLENLVNEIIASIAEQKLDGQSDGKDVSKVVLTQSRLVWDGTRKQVQRQITELEQEIIKTCEKLNQNEDAEYEVDLSELNTKTKQLYSVLDKLDARLIDKLDEALAAEDDQVRKAKQKEAIGIIKEYLGVVKGDILLAMIDNNGFTQSNIRGTFVKALSSLAAKL